MLAMERKKLLQGTKTRSLGLKRSIGMLALLSTIMTVTFAKDLMNVNNDDDLGKIVEDLPAGESSSSETTAGEIDPNFAIVLPNSEE
jgi:hypothetical protein